MSSSQSIQWLHHDLLHSKCPIDFCLPFGLRGPAFPSQGLLPLMILKPFHLPISELRALCLRCFCGGLLYSSKCALKASLVQGTDKSLMIQICSTQLDCYAMNACFDVPGSGNYYFGGGLLYSLVVFKYLLGVPTPLQTILFPD